MNDNKALVTVIEDEEPIRRFLKASLSVEGFRVAEAATGQEGLRIVTQQSPSLILLDLGLPDMEGTDIIRQVRQWSSTPIVVLSARGEEESKVQALDAGADDYLTKPFGVSELLARVRVALRHAASLKTPGAASTIVEVADVRIDLEGRVVTKGDCDVKLTKIEFDLLAALSRNAGKVVTHSHLLKEVWGSHSIQDSHYVRVFMSSLRKKLEDNPSHPSFLITEQGVGYRLRLSDG